MAGHDDSKPERLGSLQGNTASGRRRRFAPNVSSRSNTSASAQNQQPHHHQQQQGASSDAIQRLQYNAELDAKAKRSRASRKANKRSKAQQNTGFSAPAADGAASGNPSVPEPAPSVSGAGGGGGGGTGSGQKAHEPSSVKKADGASTSAKDKPSIKAEFHVESSEWSNAETKYTGDDRSWLDKSQYYPTLLPSTRAAEEHPWVSLGLSKEALLATDAASLSSLSIETENGESEDQRRTMKAEGPMNVDNDAGEQMKTEGVHPHSDGSSSGAASFALLQLPDPWPLQGGCDASEGYVGRLRLHRDGTVTLKMNETVFEVGKGTPVGHAEQLGRLEVEQQTKVKKKEQQRVGTLDNGEEEETATGELALLGHVRGRHVAMLQC
jgi:hypothetical protein